MFQSFWTLTGNPNLRRSEPVKRLAAALEELLRGSETAADSEAIALYSLVVGLEGIVVLDGTTRFQAMEADVNGLEVVGAWAEENGKEVWEECLMGFKGLIKEQ